MLRTSSFSRFSIVVSVLTACFGAPGELVAQLTQSKIVELWKEREAKYQHVEGSWKQSIGLDPEEVKPEHLAAEVEASIPMGKVAGKLFSEVSMLFSGKSLRYDITSSPEVSPATNLICSFDGSRERLATGERGTIRAADTPGELRSIPNVAWALYYRPLSITEGGISQWNLDGNTVLIDGMTCQVMAYDWESGLRDVLYLDPDRGGIPIRYEHIAEGKTWATIDIQYRQIEEGTWEPDQWRWQSMGGGGRAYDAKFTIVEPIPADRFRSIFQPGTKVRDLTIPGRDPKTFLVTDSGELIPLTSRGNVWSVFGVGWTLLIWIAVAIVATALLVYRTRSLFRSSGKLYQDE